MTTSQSQQNLAHELFDFLCHAHKSALDLVAQLKFDRKHPWHRNLVSLYGTMIELTGAVCILIPKNISIAVPILLRSLVEAYLDFVNLAKDRRYGYHMRASELKEWVKLLNKARNSINPFLKGIGQAANLKTTLAKWEQELKQLKTKGYKPLSPAEKFGKANLGPLYDSVYNDLCCDSHNNIRALISRHLNISPGQTDFEIEFYPSSDYVALLAYTDTFCDVLVSATERIHDILQTNSSSEIIKLKNELERLRNAILTEQEAQADA